MIKLMPEDYYDSIGIYESDISFSTILDELCESDYTIAERKAIFKTLCNDLINEYLIYD